MSFLVKFFRVKNDFFVCALLCIKLGIIARYASLWGKRGMLVGAMEREFVMNP